VRRRGGVLYIAAEGASEIFKRIAARLKTVAGASGEPLPFAWCDRCPTLLEKGALQILIATAQQVTERMSREFGLELVLIIVDTMASVAGYLGEGENQTGPTQRR
jgi:AAA domain